MSSKLDALDRRAAEARVAKGLFVARVGAVARCSPAIVFVLPLLESFAINPECCLLI